MRPARGGGRATVADQTFLTVPEVAARWHLTARAVRDEINRKRLLATKIGGQWLVKPGDVEAFEALHLNVPQTAKRTRVPKRRARS